MVKPMTPHDFSIVAKELGTKIVWTDEFTNAYWLIFVGAVKA
jgi:hypothetical protein